jgi:hypothetical protein
MPNRSPALRLLALGAGFLVAVLAGCSDQGDPPTLTPPPAETPDVSALVPGRTVVGDTVVVEGVRFGTTQESSSVLFRGAGEAAVPATVVNGGWGDASIRVLVPVGAVDGTVSVRKGEAVGAGRDFEVAPALISFGDDVVPILQQKGCTGCHGSNGGLAVTPRAALLAGGDHGPVVVPRRSAESNLIRKLGTDPPFGSRMPAGGAPLTAEQVRVIADWIDQGARPDVEPPPPVPAISELVPARTVVGDTVVVAGADFGTEPLDGSVRFTAATGGSLSAEVVAGGWSATAIRVLVPEGAATGPLTVMRGAQTSESVEFDLATTVVSYESDLGPLFLASGCESCHGGTGGLWVSPYASLMAGDSDHGPAVQRRRGAQSLLVRVLGDNPPFGLPRMPSGSPALSPAQIRLISDWIDQGARNN